MKAGGAVMLRLKNVNLDQPACSKKKKGVTPPNKSFWRQEDILSRHLTGLTSKCVKNMHNTKKTMLVWITLAAIPFFNISESNGLQPGKSGAQ